MRRADPLRRSTTTQRPRLDSGRARYTLPVDSQSDADLNDHVLLGVVVDEPDVLRPSETMDDTIIHVLSNALTERQPQAATAHAHRLRLPLHRQTASPCAFSAEEPTAHSCQDDQPPRDHEQSEDREERAPSLCETGRGSSGRRTCHPTSRTARRALRYLSSLDRPGTLRRSILEGSQWWVGSHRRRGRPWLGAKEKPCSEQQCATCSGDGSGS